MNFHVCIQDKFLVPYIEDVYLLNEQDNNIFWFRGNKGDSAFFETNRPVEYIGNSKDELINRLKQLSKEDRIFVHWYDAWIADVLLNVSNKLFVYHWGGEFFTTPFGIQMNWLFDKKTLKYVKDTKNLNLIWRFNILEMYRQWKSIRMFYLNAKKENEVRNKQVERVDYILMTEGHDSDILKTKELFPKFKARYLYSFYNSNFSEAISLKKGNSKNKQLKVLLGNSADPTNNHLDAFDKLKRVRDIKIYCPLSYGNENYSELVIKNGIEIFGDNFISIKDFMTRDKYIDFLNEMDVVVMYHNRSQAWGNILTSLTLGKPIFMKKNNSLYPSIQKMGLPIFDVESISQKQIINAMNQMKEIQDSISDLLEHKYSKQVRLDNLRNVLNYEM